MKKVVALSMAIGLVAGCGHKPSPAPRPPKPTPLSAPSGDAANTNPLLRVHFAGASALANNTNAAKLREVLSLPATAAFRELALQNIARATGKLTALGPATNDTAARLVPTLLNDLINFESYAEWQSVTTNGVPLWTLAVKPDDARAVAWQSSLAALINAWQLAPVAMQAEGFTGIAAVNETAGAFISFARARDWLVLATGQVGVTNGHPLLRQIRETGRPAPAAGDWLKIEANLPRLAKQFSWPANVAWPQATAVVNGKGENVRTTARFEFPEPIYWRLQPWQVPKRAIQDPADDPMICFAALRGFGDWLGRQALARRLGLEPAPDQLFVWAHSVIPYQTYFALPAKDAAQQIEPLAGRLDGLLNAELKTNGIGKVSFLANRSEAVWVGLPLLAPFLRAGAGAGGDFFLAGTMAGIVPPAVNTNPPPADLLAQLNRTNLLYYDWEITEPRLEQWRQLWQLLGLAVPDLGGNLAPVALDWLKAAGPKLGNTITEATVASPTQLDVVRTSHSGFTALELLALTRWLGSPQFPAFAAPAAPMPAGKASTNP